MSGIFFIEFSKYLGFFYSVVLMVVVNLFSFIVVCLGLWDVRGMEEFLIISDGNVESLYM